MTTADSHKKFVLCITDAFTKYAVATAIASKDAEIVADAIYVDCQHTKTSPAHPQCNA